MPSDITYEQLDENERVALTYIIAYSHLTMREALPKLFGRKASESTHYRNYRKGLGSLKERSILDEDGNPTDLVFRIITTAPQGVLKQAIEHLRNNVHECWRKFYDKSIEYGRVESQLKSLQDENKTLRGELERLEELRQAKEKLDFTEHYQRLKSEISEELKLEVDKAIERFYADDYVSTILNAYRVSEKITRGLFKHLYGENEAEKVRKHEDRLKRLWNDDHLEKREYPGISVIASLFSIILWYRNKMAAHTEMPPTMEAARISLTALIQSIEELKRLKLTEKITKQTNKIDIQKFVESVGKTPLSVLLGKFNNLDIETNKRIFEEILNKIALLDWRELAKNRELLDFLKAALKSADSSAQSELFEVLLQGTVINESFSAKEELLKIIKEITKISSVRNYVKKEGVHRLSYN